MRYLRHALATGGLLAAMGLFAHAAPGDLGTNMAGEACRLGPTRGEAADILCGASAVKMGAVHRIAASTFPPGEAARRGAVGAAIRQLPGNDTEAGLRCDSGRSLDAVTLLFSCNAGVSATPHIVLASVTPRGLFLASGLPGTIGVMVAAITERSGTAMSGSAAVAAVRAAFSPQVLTAGVGAFSGYQQLLQAGSRAAAGRNFAAAEAAYREALDVESRLFGPNSAVIGATLMELALQVSNQQRFDEAAALFRRATPIIESAPSPEIRARLASYRGLDAANQRNYEDALKYAREDVAARLAAVEAIRSGGLDLNGNPPRVPTLLQGELAHALRIQAEMAMRTGDLAGAQVAAERTLLIITEHPDLPLAWRADIVSLMGEINARLGRVVPAERNLTDALAMSRKLYGEGGATIMAQFALGRFYSDEQVYGSSISAYREAFAALAKDPLIRGQVVADQIVPFMAAATASLGGAERTRLEQEMFAASQLVDSGVAGQTIARMAARRAAENPALAENVRLSDDAGRARDEIRMQLAAERAKPDGSRDAAREQRLSADLAAAVSLASGLQEKLRADFPAYAGLADPGMASLEAVQRALRPREAFVSFVLGVRGSYILLVTRDGLTVKPLTINRAELAADIADLRSAFVPQLGKVPAFSLVNAEALYRSTLGPVAPQLAGVDRLVVAASGDLASLPFALLVTSTPTGPRDYASAAWLIRQTAVTQIPSARAFLALRGTPSVPQPRPFLGIGNPVFQGKAGSALALNALASSCQQGGTADPALLRALQPLPDTAAEIQAVGLGLGASPDDILLGAAANESALRAKPLDQYAVLYFATHGLLPGELHCQAQPGLVLTPPGAAQPSGSDGLLTASEIAGLRLNADLVVLSACNTAASGGKSFGGGALQGLADSFFNAGAHAVLASHWEVPSVATRALMTELFARLAQDPNRDAAEALRQAQLSLVARDDTAHPFAWAAFTLIGDGA